MRIRRPFTARGLAVPAPIRFLAEAGWLLMALLAAWLAFARPAAAADTEDGGPRQLLITYRADAANRPAFRNHLAHDGRAPFDKLVKEGALKEYRVLFNPYNSSGTWDALIILSFNRYADVRKWMELERVSPGGLTPAGLKLAKPVDSYSADLLWQGSTPDASAKDAIYYVIPYEYTTNGPEYKRYVDAYVIPQAQGWMKEGVLSGYRFYMNRFGTGKPWDALFVYQYKDLESFGRRDEAVAKVRAGLKDNAEWQRLNAIKQTLRSEAENTITELVEAR